METYWEEKLEIRIRYYSGIDSVIVRTITYPAVDGSSAFQRDIALMELASNPIEFPAISEILSVNTIELSIKSR